MSDRREQVAKAMLRDHLLRWDGTDDDVAEMWADTVTQQEYLLQADAAIAAYESSVAFECDEFGGRGKIVGQYDQDDALAAMDAEPTDPNDAHAALGLPKGVTLEPLDDDDPTEAEIERFTHERYSVALDAIAADMERRLTGQVEWGALRHALAQSLDAGRYDLIAARTARP